MKKISKTTLITSLVATTLGVSVLTPLIVTEVNKNKVKKEPSIVYNFDGKQFNSKNDLQMYALEQATKENVEETNRESWTLNVNNEKINFKSFDELSKFVKNKINTYQVISSQKYDALSKDELTPEQLSNLHLSSEKNETVTIYKGIDDQYFLTEEEAKLSYLQMHEAYYFDGLYFRNKQELANYLNKNFDRFQTQQQKKDSFILKSPNNLWSRPFSLEKLKQKDPYEIKEFSSFISNNSQNYLRTQNNNKSISYNYVKSENIINNPGQYINNFSDYNYITVNSNQGKGNYIVDLKQDDEYDLFGPYYLQTGGEIEQITDPKSWNKLEGTDFSYVTNATNVELLSKFVDLISNDKVNSMDKEDNDQLKYPFEIESLHQQTTNYFDNLKAKAPQVYNSVMNLFKEIVNGKRYSIFYKIPILYVKTIEELMFYKIDYSLVKETRDYYAGICDYLDEQLKLFLHPDFLKHKNGVDTFSFKELYKIDVNNLDLSYDIESLVDILNQSYPKILPAINVISKLQTIGLSIPDLLEYDKEYIKQQLLDIVPLEKDGTWIFDNYSAWLENIFYLLTSADKNKVDEAIKNLLNMHNSERVKKFRNGELELNENENELFFNQIVYPRIQVANNVISNTVRELIDNEDYIMGRSSTKSASINILGKISRTYWNKLLWLAKNNPAKITVKLLSSLIFATQQNVTFKIDEYVNNNLDTNKFLSNWVHGLFGVQKFFMSPIMSVIDSFFGFPLASLLVEGTLNLVEGAINIVISDQFRNAMSAINNLMGAINDVCEVISKVGSVFKCVPFVSVALAVLDILSNLVKTEYYSYIFTTEDASFIWNGGKSTSYFFGLIPGKTRGPEAMKIMAPQQVTRPHISNEYYYKQQYYDDVTNLKKDQLVDIASGRLNVENSKLVYSFKNLFGNEESNDQFQSFQKEGFENLGDINTPGTLINDVYLDIIGQRTKYTTATPTKLADGTITFDPSQAQDSQINNFVNQEIKPIKIAMIPNLKDEYPIKNEFNQELSPFVLPEKEWTSFSGIIQNNKDYKYVIVDPNIEQQNSKTIDAEQKLKDEFLTKFQVESKTVLKNDLFKYDNFSDFNDSISSYNIYQVTNNLNKTKYFLNEGAAFQWLLNQYEFSVNDIIIQKDVYTYKDKKFNSLDEYMDYVYKVATGE